MSTRKGRRIALALVAAVVVLLSVVAWLSREHIRFMLAFESLGPNAQGYDEYRHRQTGIVFVSLPGGTFLMGSPEDEEGREEHEGPVHEVTLSPFMIAKHEVTQEQWEGVMGSNPSKFKRENLPVENVSWDDCQEFCATTGLALPTEAQWEYACRGGSNGGFSGNGQLDHIGWYLENSGARPHPVGEKQPNDFGLHDTYGNVSEWCEDTWEPNFYERFEASRRNPVSGSGSEDRVLRGGCFFSDAGFCRCAYRIGAQSAGRFVSVGLRPAGRLP